MAAATDWRKNLKNTDIFHKFKNNHVKSDRSNFSKRLVIIENGFLYVWDSFNCCIYCTNLKSLLGKQRITDSTSHSDATYSQANTEHLSCQTLLCSNAPVFKVNRIVLNEGGSLMCLVGKTGVSVMCLPRRWGKHQMYEGGKERINCRTVSIMDHLLTSHSKLSVLQASWIPDHISDSHLMLLMSDNKLRIVNAHEPQATIHTHNLSGSDCHRASMGARQLGEQAVAFDFGSPLQQSGSGDTASRGSASEQTTDTVLPVYVLWGNGDVYTLNTSLNRRLCGTIQGPLLMYPPADDNYGTDACDIVHLDTVPSVLVIATCTGRIYNALLLPQDAHMQCATVSGSRNDDAESTLAAISDRDGLSHGLFVCESIELELSLTTVQATTDQLIPDTYSCPIHIHKDPSSANRYYCSHNAGVHSVWMPWTKDYQTFVTDEESDPSILDQHNESIVEHLICTKPLPNSPCLPLLGVAITDDRLLGSTLLAVTDEHTPIAVPLIDSAPFSPTPLLSASFSQDLPSPIKKSKAEAFDEHVKKILQRTSCNPLIMSSSDSSLTTEECFRLLSRATQVLREQYIMKQEIAKDTIQHRVHVLKSQKQQQLTDTQLLAQEKQQLTVQAARLTDRYDTIADHQQALMSRCELLLHRLQTHTPSLTEAERAMHNELKDMEEKLNYVKNSTEAVKMKHDYQNKQLPGHLTSKPAVELNSRKTTQLKSLLKEEGDQINAIMKQVKQLKLELNA